MLSAKLCNPHTNTLQSASRTSLSRPHSLTLCCISLHLSHFHSLSHLYTLTLTFKELLQEVQHVICNQLLTRHIVTRVLVCVFCVEKGQDVKRVGKV